MNLDEIGPWSEIKLDILRDYAVPYSTILRRKGFHYGYVDAFSGPGLHIRKSDGEEVLGSPLVALGVVPPFPEYHFIDLDGEKVSHLKNKVGEREDVTFYQGDCNQVLSEKVFPRFTYQQRTRALCVLDPYKLTLDWKVVEQAGKSRAIEVFINFPVMHMNRNCKRADVREIIPGEIRAMDSFWGDRSWHQSMFRPSAQMTFDGGAEFEKNDNLDLANAYCERLRTVAGFGFVAEPLPMKNSKQGIVYYLIFAGPNETGWKIVRDIYKKYR